MEVIQLMLYCQVMGRSWNLIIPDVEELTALLVLVEQMSHNSQHYIKLMRFGFIKTRHAYTLYTAYFSWWNSIYITCISKEVEELSCELPASCE